MSSLTSRRLLIILGLLLVVGAFAGMKWMFGLKEEAPRKPKENRTKTVQVAPVQNQNLATTLEVQGQLTAFDKVDLFSEVGGTLVSTAKPFKVGTYFAKGSPMLRIDDTEARLALLAQKSTFLSAIAQILPDLKIDYPASFAQWEAYLNNFQLEGQLAPLPEPVNEQEKRFLAARTLYSQYYNIKSQEERLSKFTIYAPFSGVLTATTVHPGTVVRVGQQLGSLMATDHYELVATVPLEDLNYLKVGNPVKLWSEDIAGSWQGRIKRISNQIDPASQTVQVFVDVRGKDLREGMYLHGEAAAQTVANAYRLARDLLINQQQVYELQDSTLRLRPVDVVKVEPEHVIV
ncbi:MAG: HlyD family efflux transporter periplasmic adaptor subunit, partial [Bacteroidetes bacterium]